MGLHINSFTFSENRSQQVYLSFQISSAIKCTLLKSKFDASILQGQNKANWFRIIKSNSKIVQIFSHADHIVLNNLYLHVYHLHTY